MPWKSTDKSHMPGASIVPAFAPVSSSGLELIRTLPPQQQVPRGAMLLEQDKPAHWVYLVHSGMVKLVFLSQEGSEQTIGLRSVGWYCGAVPVLMNAPSLYSVQAITPCVVHPIAAGEFLDRLMQNTKVMKHFMRMLCHELCSQASAQVEIMSRNATDRLVRFMEERKMSGENWKAVDPLPVLKKLELAQLLSISPEHLSRLLHKQAGNEDVEPKAS
jgi:CRP/FNR family transcriptional regulator